RNVGPLPVVTLNAPNANVTAFRIAPSRVPVPKREKMPGGALTSMVTLVENVADAVVTVSVCTPSGVVLLSTTFNCVGETKHIPAAAPPTETLVPPKVIGGLSALEVTATPVARLDPKMEIILPGARDVLLRNDAALVTLTIWAAALAANTPARARTGKT